MQVDEPPLLNEVGLHETLVSVGNGTVIVPPVPVTEIGLPDAPLPAMLESPIAVLSAEVVIVTVSVATAPFCITLSLVPASRHV